MYKRFNEKWGYFFKLRKKYNKENPNIREMVLELLNYEYEQHQLIGTTHDDLYKDIVQILYTKKEREKKMDEVMQEIKSTYNKVSDYFKINNTHYIRPYEEIYQEIEKVLNTLTLEKKIVRHVNKVDRTRTHVSYEPAGRVIIERILNKMPY